MDYVIEKLEFILRAVQGVAGVYAAVMLAVMGYHYMTKNRQKLDEAQDGIKNVVIGFMIVVGAEAIIQWLQ
ncbi:hypothetical protein [Tetragenococcus halophilus]|uniref:Uncharacterized protein n=2 Tax=Tetragenococcus halophilus TaxID=51669 RepID=A0AAN1VRR7_TETHN|nr:hypothetical protein [Tetragenococcus halophilus]MCO7027626.1 hypothetical protein [Tetragenococcus halophilus]NRR75592.1 hypothetical protein [Tetragenococcus halophilus]NWN99765.1 hypothetical protein [Tetragenococcus halophilus]QGP77192.1 hypothetical protein GLW17_10570 [Tetragenococcus halophilus]BAK95372.1 hypothetical protein TEH_20450 [Tetragenococcus halophilus NBRC 12172]